jgi:hypothetical protein
MQIKWKGTFRVRFTRALYPDRKTSSDVVESSGTKQSLICLEAEQAGPDGECDEDAPVRSIAEEAAAGAPGV